MAVYQLATEQKLTTSIDDIWDFISTPANLKKITPDYMGFDITSGGLPEKMYPGMIITYKVSPLMGLKMTWVTEITHVVDKAYFVDEQRVGPYKIWHHQHRIEPVDNGVLMTDLVTYVPPLGILGALANTMIIRKKLKQIFDYRRNVLADLFGEVE